MGLGAAAPLVIGAGIAGVVVGLLVPESEVLHHGRAVDRYEAYINQMESMAVSRALVVSQVRGGYARAVLADRAQQASADIAR